jgi:cytochrome c oxidase cbb3-type subunit 2
MPSYEWLFDTKDSASTGDVVVNVPTEFRVGMTGKIVALPKALALIAYLQSLKQVELPDGKRVPLFLYPREAATDGAGKDAGNRSPKTQMDGRALYAANCQSCHQANGEGLAGAFPPLKGSKIVLDENPETQITIIMKGFNGRVSEGYGIMPPIGTNNELKPGEVAAIINHERSSWGNSSKAVTIDEIIKIIAAFPNSAPGK